MSFSKKILVATSLRPEDQALYETAISLARRLKADLQLVYAIEPMAAGAAFETVPLIDVQLEQSLLENACSEMERTVAELKPRLPTSVKGEIVWKQRSAAILAEAQKVEASLILCGFNPQHDKGILRGFATATALLQNTDRPCFCVKINDDLPALDIDQLSVLIADDLRVQSEELVQRAVTFARDIGAKQIVHAHVISEQFGEEVLRWLHLSGSDAQKVESIRYSRASNDPLLLNSLKERARISQWQAHHPDLSYVPALVRGEVAEELLKLYQAHGAQMVIMGPHRWLRPSDLSLGRLPLQQMLKHFGLFAVIP